MTKPTPISRFLFISLLFSANLCYSQNRITPKVYLNSEQVSFDDIFIKPNNLYSITVDNKPDTEIIYIKTKKNPWKYRILESILKENNLYKQIEPERETKEYIRIDGQIVKDISTIRIDAQYKTIVTVEQMKKAEQKEIIINIWLTKKACRKFRKTNQYPIYIRGLEIRT
jgi:hypothetical protein